MPAHATAMGRALLAFSPTDVLNSAIAEEMRTASPVDSPDNLRQALAAIRLTQIATARDEYHVDRSAIAMPVFSGGGRVAAAVELTVRESGTDRESVTAALTVACRSFSRQLATECGAYPSLRRIGNGNGNGSNGDDLKHNGSKPSA